MTRIFTLLTLFVTLCFSSNSQQVYVDNGSNNTYNLAPGDSLVIKHGTFTGSVYAWVAGSKITVQSGANFKPANLYNYVFSLEVYGTAVLNNFTGLAGFRLKNYGTVTINGYAQMAQAAQTFNNYYGATLNFNSSFAMNISGGFFMNQGIINIKGDFSINSNSSFVNRHIMNIDGNATINSGGMSNLGQVYSKGKLTVNSGTLTNGCRTIAENGIEINNSTITNDGLLWASDTKKNSFIKNSGTIIGYPNSKLKATNLHNWGTVKGEGFLFFTGHTIGGGTFGAPGQTKDTLRVYDVTRSNPNKIFDSHNSNVRPNTIYQVFQAPDTLNIYPHCASEFASGIPLPVKFEAFYVNMVDQIPMLTWISTQAAGTEFSIERSYDGTKFEPIATVIGQNGETKFNFSDRGVSASAKLAYYRISGTEPGLAPKLSETRSVKFSNNSGVSLQAVPNPFTSQFNINFQSAERSTILISIYNMSGQLQFAKQVSVSAGFNSIAVYEASKLSKGMYVVRVNLDGQVIATEKVIRN